MSSMATTVSVDADVRGYGGPYDVIARQLGVLTIGSRFTQEFTEDPQGRADADQFFLLQQEWTAAPERFCAFCLGGPEYRFPGLGPRIQAVLRAGIGLAVSASRSGPFVRCRDEQEARQIGHLHAKVGTDRLLSLLRARDHSRVIEPSP